MMSLTRCKKKANAEAAEVLAQHTEVVNLSEEQLADFKKAAMPVRDYYKKSLSKRAANMLEKLENELASFK